MKRIKPEVSEIVDNSVEAYCEKYSSKPTELSKLILKSTDENLLFSDMICGSLVGNLLRLLMMLKRPKRVLEIGAFTGYSASYMASQLPKDGKLITIEGNEKYRKLFRASFENTEEGNKIELVPGFALEEIPKLKDGEFDLIFVDADKINYPHYLKLLKPKLAEGGIIVFDNTIWGGGVLKPEDKKSLAVHNLNVALSEDDDFFNLLLPIRDGVHIGILQ